MVYGPLGLWGESMVETGQDTPLHIGSDDSFNCSNHHLVVSGDERQGLAFSLGTAGSPDTMDIGVGTGRNIVIDHMRYPGNIDSPRCDVRCY